MMQMHAALAAVVVLATGGAAMAQPLAGRTPDEVAVLAADARQRDAVATRDLAAIAAGAHANLRINAPTNQVLTRENLVSMVGTGEIRNDDFVRTAESVTVTGDVAVVMGHEDLVTDPQSAQGRMYGAGRALKRRYTNVYVREGGKWLHLARHANVVVEPRP